MTKEEFIALGLTEDQAKAAAEASATELKGFVPIHRFEEVNTENKTLKTTVKENEKSLEELKKATGDSEALNAQIQKLQEETSAKEKQYQEDMKTLKMTNAIKLAIAGKAQDEDLVSGLVDKSKLILNEDGSITGLEEQVKTLQENKGFLFKEQQEEKGPGFKVGSNPPSNKEQPTTGSLKDAVASYLQQNN